MYFFIDTAKGTRINHYTRSKEFMPDKNKHKTIKKGDKCLVFCNGTIGQGRLSYNYAKNDAIKMLQSLILDLQQ